MKLVREIKSVCLGSNIKTNIIVTALVVSLPAWWIARLVKIIAMFI